MTGQYNVVMKTIDEGMKRKSIKLLLNILIFCFFSSGLSAAGEPVIGYDFLLQDYNEREDLSASLIFETFSRNEKDRLGIIKEKDKNKFERILQKQLAKQKKYLEQLKGKDPGKFRQIMVEARRSIRAVLRKLQRENPEKFQSLLEESLEKKRMQFKTMCRDNPEKAGSVIARRREINHNILERLKRENPLQYKAIMEKPPAGEDQPDPGQNKEFRKRL